MQNVSAEKINVLIGLNRLDEAEQHVRLGLASEPESADFLSQLGRIHILRDECSEGLEVLRKVLRLEPSNDWAFRLAAVAAKDLGMIDVAIGYAGEAVRISPSCESFCTQSRVYIAAGEEEDDRIMWYARAFESAQAALKENAEHVSSLLVIARLEFACRKYVEARPYVEKALAIEPESLEGHNILGQISENLGQHKQAMDHYISAGKLDPTDSFARARIHSLLLPNSIKFLSLGLLIAGSCAVWVFFMADEYLRVWAAPAFALCFCVLLLAQLGPRYMLWRKIPEGMRTFLGSFVFPKGKNGKKNFLVLATIVVSVLPLFLIIGSLFW